MRDARGRFATGNGGGPGRPSREVETDYLSGMRAQVSPEDWNRIVRRAVSDAKRGGASAREWLSKYLLPSADSMELAAASAEMPGVKVILPWNDRADPSLMGDVLRRETKEECEVRQGGDV